MLTEVRRQQDRQGYYPMITVMKQQIKKSAREIITGSGNTNDNFSVFKCIVNSIESGSLIDMHDMYI